MLFLQRLSNQVDVCAVTSVDEITSKPFEGESNSIPDTSNILGFLSPESQVRRERGWTDGRKDEQVRRDDVDRCRQENEQTDKRMDRWTDGWENE